MPYFDRIDISKGIDVTKTSASKECDICHYWYCLNYSLKFQPNVGNRCHNLLIRSFNLSNKGSDYRCIISLISKNETINLLQNDDLTDKSRTLRNIKNLFSYMKMGREILTFGNIESEKKNLPP